MLSSGKDSVEAIQQGLLLDMFETQIPLQPTAGSLAGGGDVQFFERMNLRTVSLSSEAIRELNQEYLARRKESLVVILQEMGPEFVTRQASAVVWAHFCRLLQLDKPVRSQREALAAYYEQKLTVACRFTMAMVLAVKERGATDAEALGAIEVSTTSVVTPFCRLGYYSLILLMKALQKQEDGAISPNILLNGPGRGLQLCRERIQQHLGEYLATLPSDELESLLLTVSRDRLGVEGRKVMLLEEEAVRGYLCAVRASLNKHMA